MEKGSLLSIIGETIFDLSLAIHEEFGGYHQDIPEKSRLVLILLSRYEQLYVKDLARLLHVSPSRVSQLLSRMEKQQYIVRQLDPNDRTYTFVKLGEKGHEIVKEIKNTGNIISSKYIMELSYSDLQSLYEIINKLKAIMDDKKEGRNL